MASPLDSQPKLPLRESISTPRVPAIDSFSMPFDTGQVIVGKYQILRLIGTGGVGFVVAARHIGFDEVVALKFLRPEFSTHAEAVSRFTIEARASFKIKSEHVARVLDVDATEDGIPFIAMELLQGADLRTLLDQNRVLAIAPAVDYALQVCEALAAAHSLQIIHRDIKPENLFLTGAGDEHDQLKVLDFGISKVALTHGRKTHQALTRIAVGTPPYMSPEQVRASSDLDARADIWSLGCVLYELLSGTAPFDRMSLMQSCAAVLEEEPVPVRDLRLLVPSELDSVVMCCLQKDPDARFQNVAELAEALTPFGSLRFASYAARCRAYLNGEGIGRRSTPSGLPAITRHTQSVAVQNDSLAPRRATNLAVRSATAEFARRQPTNTALRVPSRVGVVMPANAAITPRTAALAAASELDELENDAVIRRRTVLMANEKSSAMRRWPLWVGPLLLIAISVFVLLNRSEPHASLHATGPMPAPVSAGVAVQPLAAPPAAPAQAERPVASTPWSSPPGTAEVVAPSTAAIPSGVSPQTAAEVIAQPTAAKTKPTAAKVRPHAQRPGPTVRTSNAADEPDVGF
jgi:serine/threonine protein kinase